MTPIRSLAGFALAVLRVELIREIDFIVDFSPEHVETLRAQNPRAQIMTGKETTPWWP